MVRRGRRFESVRGLIVFACLAASAVVSAGASCAGRRPRSVHQRPPWTLFRTQLVEHSDRALASVRCVTASARRRVSPWFVGDRARTCCARGSGRCVRGAVPPTGFAARSASPVATRPAVSGACPSLDSAPPPRPASPCRLEPRGRRPCSASLLLSVSRRPCCSRASHG